ncbi:MAG: hemolysin family protein [Elusimicrobiota bacterium]
MIYAALIILTLFSGFFSSIETALYSMGEARIREWAKHRIISLNYWITEPAGVITGILTGNNMVNISFSAIFTVVVASFIARTKIPSTFIEIISIFGSSAVILTFGEIIPKTFANTYPDKIIKACYPPFIIFYKPLRTFSNRLNKISFSIVGKLQSKREKTISRKEIQMEIEEAGKKGHLEKASSQMLSGTIMLSQKKVKEVMTDRKKIVGINLNRSYNRIMKKLIECKYSRIPAYSGKLDKLKGFIYVKDVIGQLNDKGSVDFKKILREAKVTRQNKNCRRLFQEMRKERVHICVVKSKKRITGIVTIEDLIEEVVGEIHDEYDNDI